MLSRVQLDDSHPPTSFFTPLCSGLVLGSFPVLRGGSLGVPRQQEGGLDFLPLPTTHDTALRCKAENRDTEEDEAGKHHKDRISYWLS